MKKIKLKQIFIENFKGCKENLITFGDKTTINGANATGKTTVVDAFMWLLFNKDSAGNTKFQIRPVDSDGKDIDSIEIKVVGVLNVDGDEIELHKVQKQKWVKRRNSQEKELQGNVNEYEVNGYPKSEKEYQQIIADIVDEDLFKVLTNPTCFTSKPWQEQRELLMKLVSDDVSDIEIANSNDDTKILVGELERAPVDDIKKKFQKSMSGLKKKQVELPARIDEISKQIKEVDTDELEKKKESIQGQIAEQKAKLEDSSKQLSDFEQKTEDCMKLKFDITQMKNAIELKVSNQNREHEEKIQKIKNEISSGNRKVSLFEADIKSKQNLTEVNETEKKKMQNLYVEIKNQAFEEYVPVKKLSDDDFICPTCGQELQANVIAEKKASYEEREQANKELYAKNKEQFENEQKERLEFITQKGNNANDEIKKAKESIAERQESIQIVNATFGKLKVELSKLEEIKQPSLEDNLANNQEYQSVLLELNKKEEFLAQMQDVDQNKKSINAEIEQLQDELIEVEKELASSSNDEVKKRISELEMEQKEVNQKIADCEQMLYALDEFTIDKCNRVSSIINSKFKMIDWKLFIVQQNKGIKECCECKYNGVSFKDLNNGMKIVAGLDIITSLSNLYGVQCPVFVDNAESINGFNIPEMETQITLLYVTEDKTMKLEVINEN